MAPNKKKESEETSLYGFVFAIITGILFITLCWYAYTYFMDQKTSQGTIYIKADRSPFKVIPEDPGGMVIEYTDKKVFDKITGDKEDLSKGVNVIEDENAVDKSEFDKYVAEEAPINQEEYKDAAKTILKPILKQAKEEGSYIVEREKKVETFDDLVAMVNKQHKAEDELVEEEVEEEMEEIEKEVSQLEEKAEAAPADEIKDDSMLEIKEAFKSVSKDVVGEKIVAEEEDSNEEEAAIKSNLINKNIKVALKPSTLQTSEPDIIVDAADVTYEKDDKTGKNKTVITFDNAPKSMAGKSASSSSAKVPASIASAKTSSGYYVQVSSHTKMVDLETAWSIFQNKYSSIIGSASRNVTEADINGTKFYRLSFGPYSAKQDATDKCNVIKEKGKDCLIKSY